MVEAPRWHAVEAPARPVLFVNPRSGGGRAARAGLVEAAWALGVDCVELEPGQDLAELVRDAIVAGADALGMAGGDGSLAVVAAAASAHGLPFVCLPAGTRNHFARDVGLDRRDLTGSLAAFTDGAERVIDLGEVDGRAFVNNVSVGVYGDAVQHAEYRDAQARTLLETAGEVLGPSAMAPSLEVADDRGRVHQRPAVLLVSNNPYALEPPLVPGTRPSLDGGRLGILVLDAPRGLRPGTARAWTAASLELTASAPLSAGIDGEPATLGPAVRLRSRPGALRVRIPRRI